MPSILTPSGTHFRGQLPSFKNNPIDRTAVPAFSRQEQAAAVLLEMSPYVMKFGDSQAMTFALRVRDREFRYTPDFWAVLCDGSELYIEVKMAKDLRRPSVAADLIQKRAGMAAQGKRLIVWDEQIYIGGTRNDTLRRLRPFVGALDKDELDHANQIVERSQPRTFRNLVHLARTMERAFAWIANGIVGLDVDAPFTLESEIDIKNKELRHEEIFN